MELPETKLTTKTRYTFRHTVAAFMALRNLPETAAEQAAWWFGPEVGDKYCEKYKNHTPLGQTENAKKAVAIWAEADKSEVFAEICGWHRRQEQQKGRQQKLFVAQWFDDEGTNIQYFGSLTEAMHFVNSIDDFCGHIDIEDGYTWQRLKFLEGELASHSGQMLVEKDLWHPTV